MCDRAVIRETKTTNLMKKYSFLSLATLTLLLTTLSSCELVGGIFRAGMWFGIIAVVVVVGLVIFLIAKLFGGGR